MTPTDAACPHAEVIDCPLYHAMHVAGAVSCWHIELFQGCAVDHGANYDGLVSHLRAQWPGLIDRIESEAKRRDTDEQRKRNMRTIGLH